MFEYEVFLPRQTNFREAEVEEQTKFTMMTIEALGVPFEWNSNEPLSPIDRVRIRKLLAQHNISVIDDSNGGVKIYLDRDLIGEWFKPSFLLREDLKEIDPKSRLYVVMKCKFHSIFENEGSE